MLHSKPLSPIEESEPLGWKSPLDSDMLPGDDVDISKYVSVAYLSLVPCSTRLSIPLLKLLIYMSFSSVCVCECVCVCVCVREGG